MNEINLNFSQYNLDLDQYAIPNHDKYADFQDENHFFAKKILISDTSNIENILLEPGKFSFSKFSNYIPAFTQEIEGITRLKNASINLDEFNLAFEDDNSFAYKINENGEFDIIGSPKVIEIINNVLSEGEDLEIETSNNESIQIKKFTLTVLSESQLDQLKIATKIYLIYFKTLNIVNKENKEEEVQSSKKTYLNGNLKKLNETNLEEKTIHFSRSFKIKSEVSQTEKNLKTEEKFIEIARFKEILANEKEADKFEKKISERKWYIMNDILKSTMNDELLKNDIVRDALLVVEIKKKFNLAPQIATSLLTAA